MAKDLLAFSERMHHIRIAGAVKGKLRGSDWRRHEAKNKHEESKDGAEFTIRIERRGIVNRSGAEKTQAEEKRGPHKPAMPEEKAERQQANGQEKGNDVVAARAEGTENVAAIELASRQKIEGGGEEADPGSAPDRMNQKIADGGVRVKHGCEEAHNQRHAEDDVRVRGEAGNDLCVQHTKGKRRKSKNEADQRTGSADIEQGTGGANGRADQNKSAERADERGRGNEERIAGTDVMMTAGEDMAEFVGEQNA